ncbi:hypothetical protein CCP3SC1_1010007 [Gammaproteobacteria bacterium]
MPTVTVVVPVYNGERYLGVALTSILTQTVPPTEIIVVDDGSTDESASVAQNFGPQVRCLIQLHAGAAAARNQGIAVATGEYLAFLDADDLWAPDKLAAQLSLLTVDPVDIALGQVNHFISPELDTTERAHLRIPQGSMDGFSVGTMLIKRTVFLSVGEFDPQWRLGEFVDWWARAMAQGLRYRLLPQVVLYRRIHNDHQTLRERAAAADYVRIAKAALDRRRKNK